MNTNYTRKIIETNIPTRKATIIFALPIRATALGKCRARVRARWGGPWSALVKGGTQAARRLVTYRSPSSPPK